MTDAPLVEVRGLRKHFVQNDGLIDRLMGAEERIKAVDGVDFEIERGETLGLVGESGSGKSTTARSLLRLDEPTAGTVRYDGTDLTELSAGEMKAMRKRIQMVFQDPASSLNRRKTISQLLKQPMEIHGLYEGERDERVDELMETVGLPPQLSNRYPHEFSGGQRQRVGIARALAVDPEFIVADEPVSALDVSIQAQILNLLMDLQDELDLTILFIAHDLSVIRHFCDRVAVMYLGEIVEVADGSDLFESPQHPYTKSLLRAIPEPDPALARTRTALEGEVPSPLDPPSGCSFHSRCPNATEECMATDPPLEAISGANDGHEAACIHVDEFEYGTGFVAEEAVVDDRFSIEGFDHADEPVADGGRSDNE
ncbi:ABC-type transport system ATP-binding protein (probable substrate dipeptides/oligopeptides) [Haladaptatus paucihalophilus DX253]|uniref:ABC-type transport system ATP-binding protein (Probable substrate dipeptides/oligopeptides) n=1 Tax=Haladaptatus paucihalophilus DX253 TaxID=797209 RepID=E7QVE5_HALPU|nr:MULTISPECIES: oligopeptide/dipeptide ABC transporter ATP-binding protein [Haladaptatus]EFW91467.1 ABC-type transport system ATP-binding protein (probable substrate dipeptides/oligopeptides) [Haladaptatus paucihalophilus DX253]GKZ15461.1 ABC transporter ATP-binding protein [Haladaptatus sp. T7]SHL31810.1 peptide/nickel transport system ATP-binding protein/oligopeptide transport system ATP-binding protein [Haladaptatus paucihalophilus DX253]